jgi:hypothetical protein
VSIDMVGLDVRGQGDRRYTGSPGLASSNQCARAAIPVGKRHTG